MPTPSKPHRVRRAKIVLSTTRLAELEALSEGMMRRTPELAEQLAEDAKFHGETRDRQRRELKVLQVFPIERQMAHDA